MTYSEIGSEFWESTTANVCNKIEKDTSIAMCLCGRTALDYIIRDAKAELGEKWNSVLLPSYCCDSMIEPFVNNGISIRYYTVMPSSNGLKCILPKPGEHEAIYIMYYFGYSDCDMYSQNEINQWKFAIFDTTHCCFSKTISDYSAWNIRYVYSSYRKWDNINGYSMAKKIIGEFVISPPKREMLQYVELRKEACNNKKMYIEKGIGDKDKFLSLYSRAEELIESDYVDCEALSEGIETYRKLDIDTVRKIRRENAEYLVRELKEVEGIKILFSEMDSETCPLFVPVLVKDSLRDELRRYLIRNQIYCPVHWPISEYHNYLGDEQLILYNQELSLVCDQRYNFEDMKEIVKLIKDFYNNLDG